MAVPICISLLVGIRRSVRLTNQSYLGSVISILIILPVVISKPLGLPDLVVVGLLLGDGSLVKKPRRWHLFQVCTRKNNT
jgi:hypothetical protein